MEGAPTQAAADRWLAIRRDRDTGIESIHAHFRGHAYDPHDHDDVLVGVTQQGVQRFRCGRAVHTSTAGRAILIEPGQVHDGHAPADEGFTYAMLYLPQAWVADAMRQRGMARVTPRGPGFRDTLVDDAPLARAILRAFAAVHGQAGRLARDQAFDALLGRLYEHATPAVAETPASPAAARVRDLLHARIGEDLGLDALAAAGGLDRFRLARQFRAAYGISPHAYLVRLRLRTARALLATGRAPADVAADVGFADQSHLGRWFRRAYGLTPAAYRRLCTNVPD